MLSALASGTLVRTPKSGTSASGTRWCNATLRVPCGQDKEGAALSAFVTILAFSDVADQLARLDAGDAVSVAGNLKPTEYQAKSGEIRHGMEIIANALLSAYQLRKKRGDTDRAPAEKSAPTAPPPDEWGRTYGRPGGQDFDDAITF